MPLFQKPEPQEQPQEEAAQPQADIPENPSKGLFGKPQAQVAPQASKPLFGGPVQDEQVPDSSEIEPQSDVAKQKLALIRQMVKNDEIPAIPKVLDALMNGGANVEDIKSRYKEWKTNNPEIVGDTKGNINDKASLNAQAVQGGGFGERLKNGVSEWVARNKYVASQYVEGASFGVLGGDTDAPDTPTAITGGLAYLAGSIASGILGGAAVRALPIIGPAIKGLEAGAKTSTGLFKAAKIAGSIAAEAAPLGFAAGAGGSLMHGNNVSDALKDGIVDAAFFAGGGIAAYPVLAGAGKIFARAKVARVNTVNAQAAAEGEAIAADLAKNPEAVREKLASIPKDKLTPNESVLLDTLTKVNMTQPEMGPGFQAEISKHPEALQAAHRMDMEKTAKGLFTEENAPLASLYEKDPTLKTMMDTGDYSGALNSVQSTLRNEVKNYNTLGGLSSAPFIQDKNSLYEVFADGYLGRIDPKKYPKITKTLLVDYMENPSAETLGNVIDAAGSASQAKKLFGSKFLAEEGPVDLRVDSRRAEQIVGSVLKNSLETLKDGGRITFGNLGAAQRTDDILSAAVTLRKDLQQNYVKAIKEGYGKFSDSFVHVPPEFQEYIPDQARIRYRTTEINDLIARKIQMKDSLVDLGKQFSASSSAEEKASISAMMGKMKDDITTTTKQIYSATRDINDAQIKLKNLAQEKQAQIRNLAAEIYVPSREGAGTSGMADILSRFNFKDNPYYVKKTSQLADYFNAIAVSGSKHDLPEMKGWFGGPLGLNFESLPRQINKQFGPGNPLSDGLIPQMKDRQAMAAVKFREYMDQLAPFKVKAGSKLSSIANRLGEGTLNVTDAEFTSLKPEVQRDLMGYTDESGKKVEGYVDAVRRIGKEFFDASNEVRRRNNFPEINYRENYFTPHIADSTESFGEIIKGWMAGNKEIPVQTYEGSKLLNIKMLSRQSDPTRTFFAHELPRTGAAKAYESDAQGAMEKYLHKGLDQIFTMDLIREVDAARSFAPEGVANLLDKIKDDYLLNLPSYLDKQIDKAPVVKGALKAVQKGMVQGELLFKINTALQQLTSTALNFTAGGREAISAAAQLFTKESDRKWGMSINKVLRDQYEGVDLNARLFPKMFKELNKLPHSEQIKAGIDTWKKWGMFALEKFDTMVAKHSFLTAFEKGLKSGMNYEQAAKYADIWTDRVQVSMAKIDRPEYARSTIGRALFQFQSFTTNLGAALINDIPNMAYHEGSRKVLSGLLRTAAAISLYNEAANDIGMPQPFDLRTFVPFMSTYRFGAPGFFGVMKNFFDVADSKSFSGQAAKRLARIGFDMAVPGAGQILNIANGLSAYENKKLKGASPASAIIYGPGSAKYIKKDQGKERLVEKVRKKLFQ